MGVPFQEPQSSATALGNGSMALKYAHYSPKREPLSDVFSCCLYIPVINSHGGGGRKLLILFCCDSWKGTLTGRPSILALYQTAEMLQNLKSLRGISPMGRRPSVESRNNWVCPQAAHANFLNIAAGIPYTSAAWYQEFAIFPQIGLRSFRSEYPDVPLHVIARVENVYRIEDVLVVPWKTYLQELLVQFL